MQSLVNALRTAVPPFSGPIDLGQHDWLEDALTSVLVQMRDLERLEPYADPSELLLYRRIMDSVVMVVINYWAVERTGAIGGRHTATLINPSNFHKLNGKKSGESDNVFEQNYLVMPEVDNTVARQKQKKIERVWFERWVRYHEHQPANVQFTLNSALLDSRRPKPAFISWFPAASAPTRGFTPLSINAERGAMRRWAAEPQNMVAGDPAFLRFAQAFSDMFDPGQDLYHDPAAIGAMVGWLVQQFSDLGGRCFFSIPSQLRINSGKGGAADDRDLRCVLSFSMSDRWDASFYDAAWQFFNGVAHQVLHDIMSSEYAAWAHRKWERNKSNAVYLTSHPLGRRLNSVRRLSDEVRLELARPHVPERAEILAAKAHKLHRRAEVALGFVNYINLLSDMLDPSAAVDVATSRHNNRKHPAVVGQHWLDLSEQVHRAAARATDKSTETRTVRLSSPLARPILIPRRLTAGKLARHADKEEELIELIFSELFENAANSGMPVLHEHHGPVPVFLGLTDLPMSPILEMENPILPKLVNKAAGVVRRLKDKEEERRLASGMTLADELMGQLQLGEIEFDVRRAKPQRWPALKGEHHIWRTAIRITI